MNEFISSPIWFCSYVVGAGLFLWRTYQWSKQREEIEERKKSFDALSDDFTLRAVKIHSLEKQVEQLTLDLSIVRQEAEERAKELAEYKAQHAIEERRALQWEKNYYGVREDMQKTLAHWS
jgi:chromosome segregation ATPase